jgi:hypothetical protein
VAHFRVLTNFSVQDKGNKIEFFVGNIHNTNDFGDERVQSWLDMKWIELCEVGKND